MKKLPPRQTPILFFREWESAYDETRDLDKYMPNWDGANADPVPLKLIQSTLLFFRHLEERLIPAPKSVYPVADGSVIAEWHHPGGCVQIANIMSGRISIVMMDSNGKIIPQPSETQLHAGTSDPQCGESLADGDAFEFTLAA